ncbi:zinc finger protein 711-like isoform X2 [Lineus longissimus]|uniref:zinc finger protein 711-like isoform X2 n=1 Tax=Lineus longissimus TaxID=88925 RepID=UPI002B4DCE89
MDSDDDVAYYCCHKCRGLFTSKDELKEHKGSCTGDSTGSPCAMVVRHKESPPSRKSLRMSSKNMTKMPAPAASIPTRKRKLPIDGDCSPSTSARGKSSVVKANKSTTSGRKSNTPVKTMQTRTKVAAVGAATSISSPEAVETSPRRYGLRVSAYDNLKAKLNKMSGRGDVLPSVGEGGKKNSPEAPPQEPPLKVRKRHQPKLKPDFKQKLDAVFEEVIHVNDSVECQLEVVTNTPTDEFVSRESGDIEQPGEAAETAISEAVKNEPYQGFLVEKLSSLQDDAERTSSIDKLIQDVKQSLQTKQAVLSISADMDGKVCPEVGQNETVTTSGELVESIVCEPVEVPMPEVSIEETVSTTIETVPTQTSVNTFNIGSGPDQLTVHLVEYKSEDEGVDSIDQDGSSSTDGTPRKKYNEKLEALKKSAEGRESFSDFLQKVITAHAENERRNQMKHEETTVSTTIVCPPSEEPPRAIVVHEEHSPDDEMEIVEPTRIQRKQTAQKKQRVPVHAAPNSEDYESVTEVVLGRMVAKKYRCKICQHETKFLGMMARHLSAHNSQTGGDAKVFKCDQCDFTCVFRRKLNSHMKCHLKPFICDFCCYRTTQQNDLQRHMWRHTGEMPFKCDQCDYACRQKSLLISHQRKHTGDLLSCDFSGCDYKTPYKNSLNTHKRRAHASIRRYSCATCGYQTNERSCFDKHIKMHLGLKENKCPLCNYRAITVTDIKRHMRSHVPEKKFMCDQCSYMTAYETSLRIHLMKHAGIKPFRCAECGYSSNMKSKVRRHMRVRHQTEDESTIICQNIKFSMRSGDYINHNPEQTKADFPPIMKISYGTREAANITMDEENNIQDTQIVQQFVIEEINPDTVVGTHQCADCRFSCKTASALSLHKISYHSNSIVQIVNEEVPVSSQEQHESIQLGKGQYVSGEAIPEASNVQEVQYIVSESGVDEAVSSIVAIEDSSVDDKETGQSIITLGDGVHSTGSTGPVHALVGSNQALGLMNAKKCKRQTVRFVTVEDATAVGGQAIQMVIENSSADENSGEVHFQDQSVQYVTIEDGNLEMKVEQPEAHDSAYSHYSPVVVSAESDGVSMSNITDQSVGYVTMEVKVEDPLPGVGSADTQIVTTCSVTEGVSMSNESVQYLTIPIEGNMGVKIEEPAQKVVGEDTPVVSRDSEGVITDDSVQYVTMEVKVEEPSPEVVYADSQSVTGTSERVSMSDVKKADGQSITEIAPDNSYTGHTVIYM